MDARRGEGVVCGEVSASGRDLVWDRCALSSDDGAAGAHQYAGARRAYLQRERLVESGAQKRRPAFFFFSFGTES